MGRYFGTDGFCGEAKVDHIGVRHQCGQPNVNLRQVPAQVND